MTGASYPIGEGVRKGRETGTGLTVWPRGLRIRVPGTSGKGMAAKRPRKKKPRQAPPDASPVPGAPRLRRLTPYLPAVLAALLLSLAFPPVEGSWVAYVALVPLLVMAVRTARPRRVFRAAWVGGYVFFHINLLWVTAFFAEDWVGRWLYPQPLFAFLGLFWAVFGWGLARITRATRLPVALVAPVLWVALEWVRGWLLTGLPWLYVAHTQYENLTLIQIADALGAPALSFLALATSGLGVDLLTRPLTVRSRGMAGGRHVSRAILAEGALVALAWAGTVGYGLWRLSPVEPGPEVNVIAVQTSVPQDVKREARFAQVLAFERRMIGDQVRLTREALRQAARQGIEPDLVVWPETMVPGTLNEDFLEADLEARLGDETMVRVFSKLQNRSRGYWEHAREAARMADAPVVFGAHAVDLEGAYEFEGGYMTRGPRRNTAFLIRPETPPYEAAHVYAKHHLVPFGEAVPFRESWPWLYRLLSRFTPYPYDYSLTPGGRRQEPFVVETADGPMRFQAAICYEDAFAYRIRDMVQPTGRDRAKSVHLIVNISNDGWFAGTAEHAQHLNLCVFRAVENRVPIVRSVNTGISALIDADGRIHEVVADADGNRRAVEGYVVGTLALDDRLAPYTRWGDGFARGCAVGAILLAGVAAAMHFLMKREEATA